MRFPRIRLSRRQLRTIRVMAILQGQMMNGLHIELFDEIRRRLLYWQIKTGIWNEDPLKPPAPRIHLSCP